MWFLSRLHQASNGAMETNWKPSRGWWNPSWINRYRLGDFHWFPLISFSTKEPLTQLARWPNLSAKLESCALPWIRRAKAAVLLTKLSYKGHQNGCKNADVRVRFYTVHFLLDLKESQTARSCSYHLLFVTSRLKRPLKLPRRPNPSSSASRIKKTKMGEVGWCFIPILFWNGACDTWLIHVQS